MIRKLEEKDKNFGDELTHAPDNDLDKPCSDVHILVWVNIIIIDRNIFVCIDTTFQGLQHRHIRYLIF